VAHPHQKFQGLKPPRSGIWLVTDIYNIVIHFCSKPSYPHGLTKRKYLACMPFEDRKTKFRVISSNYAATNASSIAHLSKHNIITTVQMAYYYRAK